MGKSWKVAVIGCGDMGRQHIKGWQLGGHEVVSVTDIIFSRAEAYAEEFGVPAKYPDYHEAITQPNVEIVSVCVPLAVHAPVTIFAAEKGKHVFCEKPLARNLEEVAAMESAVSKAGVTFGLGFQRNLSQGVHKAKELVQEGRVGRPVFFESDTVQEIRPKRVMHDANGNMGPLMDLGCHYYLMYETVFQSTPKTVYAQGRVLAEGRPELAEFEKLAIDSAVVTIEYESGDVGVFKVTWGMPPKFRMKSQTCRFFGPKGGAEGAFNNNTAKITLYENDGVEEIPLEVYPSLHKEQFNIFIQALEGQGEPYAGFKVGREMVTLTEAIFESVATGQVIDYRAFKEKLAQ